jgi:hypothetical protein
MMYQKGPWTEEHEFGQQAGKADPHMEMVCGVTGGTISGFYRP